jgi:hypothetical protein
MVVDDQPAAVAFLRTVFGATGDVEPNRPTEARIGDSLIMVSESGGSPADRRPPTEGTGPLSRRHSAA